MGDWQIHLELVFSWVSSGPGTAPADPFLIKTPNLDICLGQKQQNQIPEAPLKFQTCLPSHGVEPDAFLILTHNLLQHRDAPPREWRHEGAPDTPNLEHGRT